MNTKQRLRTLSILLAFVPWVQAAFAGPAATGEQAIREVRAAFNIAIRERNADAIPGFLAPEYHIVSSRNHQVHGNETERQTWSDWFAADPLALCQRDTREIRVNTGWGQAQELGDWFCRFSVEDEATEASGVYAAKWQRAVDGRWLILAEVFTALDCTGSEAGCSAPEPAASEP